MADSQVIKGVVDERVLPKLTADWVVEPISVTDLTNGDLNRDMIFRKGKRARIGTLCAYSLGAQLVWAKFTPRDEGELCDNLNNIFFAISKVEQPEA